MTKHVCDWCGGEASAPTTKRITVKSHLQDVMVTISFRKPSDALSPAISPTLHLCQRCVTLVLNDVVKQL